MMLQEQTDRQREREIVGQKGRVASGMLICLLWHGKNNSSIARNVLQKEMQKIETETNIKSAKENKTKNLKPKTKTHKSFILK